MVVTPTGIALGAGLLGALFAHKALPPLRVMLAPSYDPGPERDRCPECGGAEHFNGFGVCQHCEPF